MPTQLKKSFPATKWVTLFILIHCLCWSLVPAFTRFNLPLDSIEGALWGQQLEWGYDKNPYLNAWLTTLASYLGGENLIYIFSQLSVLACFAAVYKLGSRILTPVYAMIAVLLLEGIQYYNFHAIDFNDNTLELGLWGLAIYCFYRAMQTSKQNYQAFLYWSFTGLFTGLGLMAKYYTAALLAAMFCFMLSSKNTRRHFFMLAPYIGLVCFLIVTTPHVLWLFSHDFITVKYVFARGSSQPHWSNHFFFPLQFIWQQFEAFLPALLLGCIFFLRKKQLSKTSLANFDYTFLFWLGFGPFFLTIILSLALGTSLRAGWGMPLQSLWTLILIAMLQPTLTLKKLYSFIATIFILLFVLLLSYHLSLTHSTTTSSANFPGKEVATTVTNLWRQTYHSKLDYVAGSRWIGGNIAFYSPDHPRVFIEWKSDRAPWIDSEKLRQKGAVFVWDISDKETLPENIRRQYPQLLPEHVFEFRYKRDREHLEPVKIGVALLPPLL